MCEESRYPQDVHNVSQAIYNEVVKALGFVPIKSRPDVVDKIAGYIFVLVCQRTDPLRKEIVRLQDLKITSHKN